MGDCCVFKYDATITLHGSLLGWIFGVLFIRPMFRSLMQEHLIEMKATIEARASRSKVFPQRPTNTTSFNMYLPTAPPWSAQVNKAQIVPFSLGRRQSHARAEGRRPSSSWVIPTTGRSSRASIDTRSWTRLESSMVRFVSLQWVPAMTSTIEPLARGQQGWAL